MEKNIKCWQILRCKETRCPAYGSEDPKCWLIAGTLCRNPEPEPFFDKIQMCLTCDVFNMNTDVEAMRDSCRVIAEQFTDAKKELDLRDRELASISMEMALGLSEVFEALKRIGAGDAQVRLREDSSLELIAKLKQLVNQTALEMGEIIDLSHEFAIGLAEHFDVLHRLAKGDLDARVSGKSKTELLESLKGVTNQMIQSVQQEIAHREQVESNLRKSEEQFRMFAEKAPIGITIMGPDMRFEYINPTFVEIFGYTPADIPDKQTWFQKAYPDATYRADVISGWQESARSATRSPGEIAHRNLSVRCKDGTDKIISFRTVVLKDGTHFVTYSDITEREKAQASIKASEKKYRTLIDNIQDGVFLIQEEKLIFVKDALAKMIGYRADEIIGTEFREYIAPEDIAMVIDRYDKRKAGDTIEREYELRLLHKDGSTRVFGNMHVDVLTYQDKITHLGTIKNTTEKKLAEEEKRKLEIRLQRSSKMEALGTLAGGVAHDLNNILSGIVSYPELLLMDLPQDSRLRKPILTILKSGEKAAAIVQDLLTLARRGVATKEIVNLNQIVSGYLRSPEYDMLISFHPHVRLNTRLDSGLMNILGSPIHLSKTVMNLISNAVESMPDGGDLTIATENRYIDQPLKGYDDVREGDYVILTISDSGVGIALKDLEQIFEPFYTKKVMGRSGTGLGMAVVWGTVKDHDGYIDVHSVEGQGTIFTLYFPVTRETVLVTGQRRSLEELLGHGERILVVDDVEEQRIIASAMLGKLGYNVTALASGEAAVTFLETQSADLVVLDMIMEPGIDGLETFRRIRKRKPNQKTIIASGFSETDRVKEAQRNGAGEYLKKPYTLKKLGMAVQRALKR